MGLRSLDNNRSVDNTKAQRGSCVTVWGSFDYLSEAERQPSVKNLYQEVKYKKQMLSNLVETDKKIFKCLKTKEFISEKNLEHFSYG